MPSAVVPIAGSVISGVISGGASNKAAKTQGAAADRAAGIQKEMFEQSREDLRPFRETGIRANQKLSELMGVSDVNPGKTREDLMRKYPGLFGGNTQQKPLASRTDANPNNPNERYTMPQTYMNTFVPQKLWGQFERPSSPDSAFAQGGGDLAKYQKFSESRAAQGLPPMSPVDYLAAGQPDAPQKKLSQYMGAQ